MTGTPATYGTASNAAIPALKVGHAGHDEAGAPGPRGEISAVERVEARASDEAEAAAIHVDIARQVGECGVELIGRRHVDFAQDHNSASETETETETVTVKSDIGTPSKGMPGSGAPSRDGIRR